MRPRSLILVFSVTIAFLGGVAFGDGPKVDPAQVPGSKARQLALKLALEKQLNGSLTEELAQNTKIWQNMNIEQRRELQQKYVAFLKQSPDEQAGLMRASQEFSRLSQEQREAYQERQAWLSQVIAGLSPEQRQELLDMTPQDRAKRLLELKSKMAESQPASGPTTTPAK